MGSQRVRHDLVTEQKQGSVQAFYLSYPYVSFWVLLEKHHIAILIWPTGAVSRDSSLLAAFLIMPDSLFLSCLLSPVFVFVFFFFFLCGYYSVIKLRCHQQMSWTVLTEKTSQQWLKALAASKTEPSHSAILVFISLSFLQFQKMIF